MKKIFSILIVLVLIIVTALPVSATSKNIYDEVFSRDINIERLNEIFPNAELCEADIAQANILISRGEKTDSMKADKTPVGVYTVSGEDYKITLRKFEDGSFNMIGLVTQTRTPLSLSVERASSSEVICQLNFVENFFWYFNQSITVISNYNNQNRTYISSHGVTYTLNMYDYHYDYNPRAQSGTTSAKLDSYATMYTWEGMALSEVCVRLTAIYDSTKPGNALCDCNYYIQEREIY